MRTKVKTSAQHPPPRSGLVQLVVRTTAEDRIVSSEILPLPIGGVKENNVVLFNWLTRQFVPSYFADKTQSGSFTTKKGKRKLA